jgi:hypothetical protein
MTFGRLGHRRDHVVGEVARVRAGEADALETVDAPQARSSFANASGRRTRRRRR